jgi:DUF1680 family protein
VNVHEQEQTVQPRFRGVAALTLGFGALALIAAVQAREERAGVSPAPSVANPAVANKVPFLAQPFPLPDVRLLDGPFRDAMLRDQAYLLELDPDRLLHNFRVTAGLPSSAAPLGGWEAPDVELRGHSVGHYLSALALMYASTGDARFKQRGDLLVGELAKVQDAMPSRGFHAGYLSAFPEELIDRVEARQRVWAPYYTLHKIMAGLLDMHQLCGNQQALAVLTRQVDWVAQRMDKLPRERQQAMLMTEFGGMNDVLANLYAVTGNPEHLRLARAFDHDFLFDPMARRDDALDGLHANTQIPTIIGAAREYELTGEPRYRDIATFFWDRVAQHRSYANGGHSDDESFFPIEHFSEHLGTSSSETCNTYNMLKLSRHLFQWAPSARTMDFYERGLYNHILASQDPETGGMIYYCPFRPGAFRTYSTPTGSFWCCVGTGMENHAKYPDTIYFHDDRSLFVNLFIGSELTWREKGLVVRQETRYPEEETTRLSLSFAAKQTTTLAIKLRYPYWAEKGMAISVNGQPQPAQGTPGSYVTIERAWKTGDTIDVRLPMTLRLEPMPDDANLVAVMYGPILLVGDLGKEGLDHGRRYGPSAPQIGRLKTFDVPAFVTAANSAGQPASRQVTDRAALLAAITPVAGAPLTFVTHGLGRPADVTLRPLYRASDVRYNAYWKVYTATAWKAEAETRRAAAARRVDIAQNTLDAVDVNDERSEQAHALATAPRVEGAPPNAGRPELDERRGRDARNDGWFSYELQVLPDAPMTLVCAYRGSEGRRRVFDVLVDGQLLKTETLPYHPTELLDIEYPLPEALTRGKSRITVLFKPQPGASTGAVFDVRTIKGAR